MTKSGTNPTWYDILGVAPDATPEQIKAAWRAATDKFEPGSGTSQFRLFNEAADVLLDPRRRTEYDASLASVAEPAAPRAEEESTVPEPPSETQSEPQSEPELPPLVEPVETPASEPSSGGLLGTLGRLPLAAVVVLALLAVGSVVLAVVLALDVRDRVAVADAGSAASAAAEPALTSVLSYDYRQMDADRDRAVRFLTPKYEKQYLKTFALLTEGPDGGPGGAVKTKAVVTADVVGTGVVDAEADRVRVLAFVNQASVKGESKPAFFQNRVVVTMVERDGDWLIDNLKSY